MDQPSSSLPPSEERSIRVNAVEISSKDKDKAIKTKKDLLKRLFEPAFEAKTFPELTSHLHFAYSQLQQLNIAKSMNINLEYIRDNLSETEDLPVKINVELEERKLKVFSNAQLQATGEEKASFKSGIQLLNIFGRGESLDMQSSIGPDSVTPFQINFTKPLKGNPDLPLSFYAFKNLSHHFSQNEIILKSPFILPFDQTHNTVGLSLGSKSVLGNHLFRLESSWRVLKATKDRDMSPLLRFQAGHSLKTSLMHSFTKDTRNDTVFPTSGFLFKSTQEIAMFNGLIPGNISFLKNEISLSVYQRLFSELSLSVSTRAGQLWGSSYNVLDKFRLGGCPSLRGFYKDSLGPTHCENVLGGDFFIEGGVGLHFPILDSYKEHLRGHLFLNAGSLFDKAETMKEMMNASIGFGLAAKLFGGLRIEANMCFPLVCQRQDSARKGFQVEFGMEFL